MPVGKIAVIPPKAARCGLSSLQARRHPAEGGLLAGRQVDRVAHFCRATPGQFRIALKLEPTRLAYRHYLRVRLPQHHHQT